MSTAAPPLPAEEAAPMFPCPQCGTRHPWAEEYAGRTARCSCGGVLKVPVAPPFVAPAFAAPAPDPYGNGVATPPPPPPLPTQPGDGAAQTQPQSSPPPEFFRMAPGWGGKDELPPEVEEELEATGKYGEDDPTKEDPRRDFHVPLALVAVGFVLTLIDYAMGARTSAGAAVAGGILYVGFKLVVGMVFMLAGVLLAAKFSGISFGTLGTALLKLAGLCLGPTAVGDLTTTLLGGDGAVEYIGWAVRIVLYWAFVAYLFRLDGSQTAIVVGTISGVKFVTAVAVASLWVISVTGDAPPEATSDFRDSGDRNGSAVVEHAADEEDE